MKIGIYQTYWGRVGGGQRYIAVVAELLAQDHDVEIVHHASGFSRDSVEEPMQVNLGRVGFRYVDPIDRPKWETQNPLERLRLEREVGRHVSEPYDYFIDSSDIPPFFNHARRGALLTHFPLVSLDEYHGRDDAEARRRSLPGRLAAHAYQSFEANRRFGSYDRFLVNSSFTKYWARRYWGINASVVFPPLRADLAPKSKEPFVLSIGAFKAEQHKKQAVLIDAFKELCDTTVHGWRYVMVGASGANPADAEYLAQLRERGEGYPIEILTDVSGKKLKDLLETASILWHSMGLGVDPEREPRRMEHFGMVATEAMAAGCIPVVFNGGGLKEIVSDGHSGHLWSSPEELVATTRSLIANDDRRREMALVDVEESNRFAMPTFESSLKNALQLQGGN